MSLSGFEVAAGGIISIPLSSSLALLLYKALGEKRLDKPIISRKKFQQNQHHQPLKMNRVANTIEFLLACN